MILYNTIELIRNFYIELSTKRGDSFVVSDEFKFCVLKTYQRENKGSFKNYR